MTWSSRKEVFCVALFSVIFGTSYSKWLPVTVDVGDIDESMCTVDKAITVRIGGKTLRCGEKVAISKFEESSKAPDLVLDRANANRLYTLMMVDPDAPSRKSPSQRSWLHWLVVNIRDADVKTGDEVVEYNPPTPPSGSGYHRYVFLLMKQGGHIKPESVAGRGQFDVNAYADRNDLESLCGVSFFRTKND